MNKLLRNWVGLVAAALAVSPFSANAGDWQDNNNNYCCEEECCNEFFLGAEVIFLRYCREAETRSTDNRNDRHSYFEHDFEPGFRITAGWAQNGCRIGRLQYTYWSSDNDESGIGRGIANNDDELLREEEDIDFNQLDLLFDAFSIDDCCCGSIAFSGGLRWINQDRTYKQWEVEDTEDYVKLESEHKGIGLVFKVEGDKEFFGCWHFRPSAGFSALCTDVDYEHHDFADHGNGDLDKTDTHYKAAGSIEGALRLSRDFEVWCTKVGVSVGVEATHWYGLGGYAYLDGRNMDQGTKRFFDDGVTLIGFNAGVGFCF